MNISTKGLCSHYPIFFFFILLFFAFPLASQVEISNNIEDEKSHFPIAEDNGATNILFDTADYALTGHCARWLSTDIKAVTGYTPQIHNSFSPEDNRLIVIGTLGSSAFIDQLVEKGKINAESIRGDWERFIIQPVEDPYPGVSEALIIVGSDRRGTAYGVLSICEEIGVSPWYWWADVPIQQHSVIYMNKTRYVSQSPSVKYRGIFINDEAPALRSWAEETFGGFNHKFYEKVYELLLRQKANYLWPAMWRPTAFADDDPENARLANEYGIVISTSHHEPMMRAHDEWSRYGVGPWNYSTNKDELRKFWKEGIERMDDYESVVTVGMRGDGDEAMSEETAVELMQTIISDQRQIIADVTGKPADKTPQVWAIYKEVQDYYDKGMRVDDDITVLFCDDNWGNIRILPKKEDRDHPGGYGIYYHFDYVGGPVSYRWLNVTQIERVWEQMNLAYQWGVEDLWLVNVGDIKPMELPISFFLDFAWNVNDIRAQDLPDYYIDWAQQQFGKPHASEIAELLALYTKYNARRTPEMLSPETYSLFSYREADRIVENYKALHEKAENIFDLLPASYKSAYYQLVLSPIELCSNLNQMYVAAAKNRVYASQGRASANFYAEKVKELFRNDAELTRYYHEELQNGKWNHMMSQTHIGYTSWNNPPVNKMPAVSYVQPAKTARPGIQVEYNTNTKWKGFQPKMVYGQPASFAPFDPINDQEYYIEIFNRGTEHFNCSLSANYDWIQLSSTELEITQDEKVLISIDWTRAPAGQTTGKVLVKTPSQQFTVDVPVFNKNEITDVVGFVENNGVISMEAANYSRKYDANSINWTIIPNMGKTSSAVTAQPANFKEQNPEDGAPHLEYDFTVFDKGTIKIQTYLSPTLNYQKNEGLKFAIAIDDEIPQVVNMHEGELIPDWEYPAWWNNSVSDHIKKMLSSHEVSTAGSHTLKVWIMDPGVVFQKFVIDAGGLKPSYLGPPESIYIRPD